MKQTTEEMLEQVNCWKTKNARYTRENIKDLYFF